jgi:hypothetical protein
MLHGNYFGDRLGNWVNPWMFMHTRSNDSNVRLFVNDYNVVAGNQTDAYKQQILALIASNAPVEGIGAQGHFGSTISPSTTEARIDSLGELGLPIWITEYDSTNSSQFVRADNLETLYRIAFSKSSVDGVLMWGFWAGSHWRGSNAAIVDLSWGLNAAGQRYQSLLAEWTTITNGASDGGGVFDFRGFHGSYDIILTPPGGSPTLRRIVLDPGNETSTNRLFVNIIDSRPILHSERYSPEGQFYFQLTDDAGRSNQIQTSTTLTSWTPLTNIYNPSGTVIFTNPNPAVESSLFFRARELP